MRILLGLTAALALFAVPALAQEHADHRPTTDAAATPKPMPGMNDAEMHAHCQAIMGDKMKGQVRHDHGVEKPGHVTPPATPPSAAEMAQMHDKCAAMMATEKPAPKSK